MSDQLAILRDVGKRYVKYDDVPTLLTGLRQLFKRGKRSDLWAVRHLDLEVGRGEAIGVIGRNGSGKSTTLAMMAGVTAPTEGTLRVNGRIAPLLRLGVGFEQELTGRENVFINGMILGMTQKEIASKFDEIVAFSELEKFIDTPVKFYSSGMTVRLGFAAAVAAEPDLLIVDEVLAVGDVAFQTRSFDRMLELRDKGATVVVVSHNMAAIRRMAERCVVLHNGEVRFQGPTGDAISLYHDLLRVNVRSNTGEDQSEKVRILDLEMLGADGTPTANVATDEVVTFRFRVRFDGDVEEAVFGVSITTEAGLLVYGENSAKLNIRSFRAGDERIFTVTAPISLVGGSYIATGGVWWGTVVKEQFIAPPKIFYVSGRPGMKRGVADLNATFAIEAPASEVTE